MNDELFDTPCSNGSSISRLAARARRIDRRPRSRVRCLPELLFEYRRGRNRFGFELLHLREVGFEVRLYKNKALVITQTFQTRKGAVRWAEEGRHVIARTAETENNHAR